MRSWERTLYGALLRAYPTSFRSEYGQQMAADVAALRDARTPGMWLRLLADVARSAPRERWNSWRVRSEQRAQALRTRGVPDVDVAGSAAAGLAVFVLYAMTLAPTAAFWDAGEYITVANVLGIPHPPGNPLFVVLAGTWNIMLAWTDWPVAVRINLLSAACSALAHAFLYLCVSRAFTGAGGGSRILSRVAASAAVAMSATAFTVWSQSNVNEKVYTVSFLTVALACWLVVRWRDTRDVRALVLAGYVTALTAANHLMGVLVAPALLIFLWQVDRRVLLNRRLLATAVIAVFVALSAHLFLPLRAAQAPVVNESDPTCTSMVEAALSVYSGGRAGCAALSATLRREQYGERSVWQDPNAPGTSRHIGLVASQVTNYAQYLDWQWARSVAGNAPVFGGARPLLTLLVMLLVCLGALAHWRADRTAALLHATLLATFSVGLVAYLNFRYGYSLESARFPDPAMREVRERDYFFLIGFSLFGVWAGLGIADAWRRLSLRLQHRHLLATPVLLIALLPLPLNWTWASRAEDWTARDWAYNVLMSVEPYGVLVTNGDNDSFPIWYLQHVERIREDVTVVLSPYLGAEWYARQVRDMSRPCPEGVDPDRDHTVITCQRPFRSDRVSERLLAAWGGAPKEPPRDSVLPLDDAEIARIAASYFVADHPLTLNVRGLTATIAQGTYLTPVDTFVAAILQSSFGERPIHFMTPSPPVITLGLEDHTVRVGLTYRLNDGMGGRNIVALPDDAGRVSAGAAIDLALTDTLLSDVFIVRGRVADPRRPWVDHANLSIPSQYSLAHYAAALGHQFTGDGDGADRHARRMQFWNRFLGG